MLRMAQYWLGKTLGKLDADRTFCINHFATAAELVCALVSPFNLLSFISQVGPIEEVEYEGVACHLKLVTNIFKLITSVRAFIDWLQSTSFSNFQSPLQLPYAVNVLGIATEQSMSQDEIMQAVLTRIKETLQTCIRCNSFNCKVTYWLARIAFEEEKYVQSAEILAKLLAFDDVSMWAFISPLLFNVCRRHEKCCGHQSTGLVAKQSSSSVILYSTTGLAGLNILRYVCAIN